MKKREKAINNNKNIYDLNVKNKIYVKMTNIDLKKRSKKFVKTVEKSFKIIRNIKKRAFELDLLKKNQYIFNIRRRSFNQSRFSKKGSRYLKQKEQKEYQYTIYDRANRKK